MGCDGSRATPLHEFLARYGTEEQCREAFALARWPSGFVCPFCGHGRCSILAHRELRQCAGCARQSSLTSGTALDSTKIPLTVWFLASYRIRQDLRMTNAALSRFLGVSHIATGRMRPTLRRLAVMLGW